MGVAKNLGENQLMAENYALRKVANLFILDQLFFVAFSLLYHSPVYLFLTFSSSYYIGILIKLTA